VQNHPNDKSDSWPRVAVALIATLVAVLACGTLLLVATFLAKRFLRKGLLGKVVAPTNSPDTTLVITDIQVRT
jgi:hypothetical protein